MRIGILSRVNHVTSALRIGEQRSPLWPQRLYYAAIIATCQVNEASLTRDTLQLSRSNVNSVVRSYLLPTPVGVGVGQLTRLSSLESLATRDYQYVAIKFLRLSILGNKPVPVEWQVYYKSLVKDIDNVCISKMGDLEFL